MLQTKLQYSGPGIAMEKRHRLFEPLVQADDSTTRQYGGTGLGLSLSRSLARELGGDIRIGDCEPDEGCVFIITLANFIDELPSEKANAQIILVDNGVDAADRAQKEKFDLILMDVQMPVLDGIYNFAISRTNR